MKNGIEAMITDITATTAEAEDYTGEDGLLYLSLIHICFPVNHALQGVVCRGGFCGFFLPQAFLLGVRCV